MVKTSHFEINLHCRKEGKKQIFDFCMGAFAIICKSSQDLINFKVPLWAINHNNKPIFN